jgi:hypothetical protein
MVEQRRKPLIRPGLWSRVALLAACLSSVGCLGPAAVRSSRSKYNEAVRVTNDEQILANIVRLRYADSPIFIDLPNITSQFELAAGGSDPGPGGSQTNFGIAGLQGRDAPTLSYHPRQGREISKALLNPLSAEVYSVVSAGARLEQLLWMTLNDINDVQNAIRGTILAPRTPDDNARFLRGVHLLADIDDRGGLEVGFATSEDIRGASDPIPVSLVGGGDLLGAAKDGYVYRDKGDGRVVLYKRNRGLELKVRSPFNRSPEARELAEIFKLEFGRTRYKIESELEPDAKSEALPGSDTLYLNLRSMLQIMTFMSKGVCVPVEHVRSGEAPTTRGPDGRPFDWTSITAGNFFVASQKHRPHNAEVAIPYRGYWFFIRKDDIDSRSALSVLEVLFSLQESDDVSSGPVLTLPAAMR